MRTTHTLLPLMASCWLFWLSSCGTEQQRPPAAQTPITDQLSDTVAQEPLVPASGTPDPAVVDTTDLYDITDHGHLDPDVKSDWPKDTAFTKDQEATIRAALVIADQMAKDTLFTQILQYQADQNHVKWGKRRLGLLPAREQGQPTRYLLRRLARDGQFNFTQINGGLWPTGSTTNAQSSCRNPTTLNVKIFKYTTRSIAGTLLHERLHHFCQRHNESQYRSLNKCDIAYQAGDLVKVLHAYRVSGNKPVPSLKNYWCPELKATMKEFKLIK